MQGLVWLRGYWAQSRHIEVKYHWIKEHVGLGDGDKVRLVHCGIKQWPCLPRC